MNKKAFCIVVSVLLFCGTVYCADYDALLAKGRQAIESDNYKEASDCMGQLLIDAPDNQTKDPKVVAFGATVMAYGLMSSNSKGTDHLIKAYLKQAVESDPSWPFPKTLLDKYNNGSHK